MKGFKRFAAALAAFAVMVVMLPCAAFAANDAPVSITSVNSYAIGTLTSSEATASSTSASTSTSTSVATPATTPTATFSPLTTVPVYTSGLVMRIYFSGDIPTADVSADITMNSCNFEGQSVKANFYKGCLYFDIVGLKYANNKYDANSQGNFFSATLAGCAHNVDFHVGECVVEKPETPTPTEAPVATATPAPDPRAPGLIIKSSSISEESVNAGDEFTLSLTVYATSSGNENIVDALVSVVPDKGVIVAKGSSTNYIGTMAPGSSKTVSFPMKALADFTDGVSTVAVTVSGIGEKTGSAANATGTTISVPVTQADRFQISKVEVPESIMTGEEQTATVTFVNMGKNAINNLTVGLDCSNIQEASQSQYVGNLAAGTENSVDFNLLPMEAGTLNGTITVTYEGADGQPVTLTQDISATVEEMQSYDDGGYGDGSMDMPVDEPVQAGFPLWGTILIIVAAGALVIVLIVVVRRHAKAKKQKALEAEDEDL